MRTAGIIIPGKPLTWARAKANFNKGSGKPRYFTEPTRQAKMEEIKYLWKIAGHGVLKGPLSVEVEFLFKRPENHYNTAGQIKPQFLYERPGRGKNGGDIDNLIKIVLDALNTVAYDDDLQVADLWARKRYKGPQETAETRVVFTELTEAPMVADDQLSLMPSLFA